MDRALCHFSEAWNFETAAGLLENVWTSAFRSIRLVFDSLTHRPSSKWPRLIMDDQLTICSGYGRQVV